MASMYLEEGEYHKSDYLKATEDAVEFLEKNNSRMLNDGRENIVDVSTHLASALDFFLAESKYQKRRFDPLAIWAVKRGNWA